MDVVADAGVFADAGIGFDVAVSPDAHVGGDHHPRLDDGGGVYFRAVAHRHGERLEWTVSAHQRIVGFKGAFHHQDDFAGRAIGCFIEQDDGSGAAQRFFKIFFDVGKGDVAGFHFVNLVDAGGSECIVADDLAGLQALGEFADGNGLREFHVQSRVSFLARG